MRVFKWDIEKNELLAKTRGITFEEVVRQIETGTSCIEIEHPNQLKYPNQSILIVEIDNYIHLIPFVKTGNEYFLKTIIPSRKATKKYLGGKNGSKKTERHS